MSIDIIAALTIPLLIFSNECVFN